MENIHVVCLLDLAAFFLSKQMQSIRQNISCKRKQKFDLPGVPYINPANTAVSLSLSLLEHADCRLLSWD